MPSSDKIIYHLCFFKKTFPFQTWYKPDNESQLLAKEGCEGCYLVELPGLSNHHVSQSPVVTLKKAYRPTEQVYNH